jgi:NAD(P)-dependent dehydrogenase (short-subunit alcohol dehydrogenase family)
MQKTYLIVGASSGIGRQAALQLAAAGHRVIGTYNKHPMVNETDLLEYHSLNILDENPDFNFLPEKLDGLLYCPGSISLRPFARIKPEDFAADYQLQVLGAVKVIQAALPKLKNAENPSIVLFSTVAVQLGLSFHSQVAASKGAIEGLTRALAAEFAPKIRVNCIAPSLTDTPLAASLLSTEEKKEANAQRHPLKKIGTVGNIADMAEFLLSEKAAWMSGQILHVDGGLAALKV